MTIYRYSALSAHQAAGHEVFVFTAEPKHILEFAQIERIGRSDSGELKGFQRHQISTHIKDIRNYLARDDALLPNAVIIAFLKGVTVKRSRDGRTEVSINMKDGPPGFVVDGQQRLSALAPLDKPGFQVFVSALICKNYDELRQQFVLINSTRPLPKSLIYELLPTVEGLPERYTARRFAARVVERVNFQGGPALRAQIRQHTNPTGMISDTAMQKLVINSAAQGAVRDLIASVDREDQAVGLIDRYFAAVSRVFGGEWVGMAPRQSRLRHGAGIVAMGFVMDLLHTYGYSKTVSSFAEGLELLKPYTAWTSGVWKMPESELPWNDIQNTPSDIDLLTRYLVSTTRRQLRKARREANE